MNNSPDNKGEIRNSEQESNDDRLSKALARAAASSSTGTTTTSRQWAGFKNPRIVRVSRTFGGKDRHSKVCTIRGLRDRRIRLSVPTAIHLYDLQDRLGLSQPSKVIDWLLEATKLDIDKLPPLQIPPGNFVDFPQQSLFGQLPNSGSINLGQPHQFTPYLDANLTLMKDGQSSSDVMKEGININDDLDVDEDEVDEEEDETIDKWSRRTTNTASAQSFFPMAGSNGFVPGLINNTGLMAPNYGNMYNWYPSNLSLSQFGSHGSSSSMQPAEDHHHQQHQQQHQMFFCPPAMAATSALFPQNDNRFHLSNSSNYGSVLRDFVPHQQLHSGENNAAASQQHDKGDNS